MPTTEITKSDLNQLAIDIVKLLEPRFLTIEKSINGLDKKFDGLQTSVDAYAKRADDYMQEMLMLSRKVDRLEKWIQQMAQVTGVKLDY